MAGNNYGLQLTGKIRVFRKDKQIKGKGKKTFDVTDVWFNVSEKEDNGEWINKSMNLLFKKGVPLPNNNTVIEIIEAFPILTGTGDWQRIAFMVMDWVEIEAPKKVNRDQGQQGEALPFNDDPFEDNGTPIDISDDDLPF